MNVTEKIELIVDAALDIKKTDPAIGVILLDNIQNALNTIDALKSGEVEKVNDVSEKINIVSNILGFNLEELVIGIFEKNADVSEKAVDDETMSFITGQVDDYETFLNENELKDTLSEIRKEI